MKGAWPFDAEGWLDTTHPYQWSVVLPPRRQRDCVCLEDSSAVQAIRVFQFF